MTDKTIAEDIIRTAHFLVLPYVGKYSLPPEEAEDLEGNGILKVYGAIAKYNPEKGQVPTFAKKIITDTVHNWEKRLSKTNEIFIPMTEENETACVNVPAETSISDDELSLAKQEIVRRTIQRLPKEARQFFEDFIKLEKLEQEKSSSKKKHKQKKKNTVLNVLRRYYKLWPRQFYQLLWPKMVDQFNDAFYVECKGDPDILAWFLRKFLEGQRREGNKKQFIENNKKKGN